MLTMSSLKYHPSKFGLSIPFEFTPALPKRAGLETKGPRPRLSSRSSTSLLAIYNRGSVTGSRCVDTAARQPIKEASIKRKTPMIPITRTKANEKSTYQRPDHHHLISLTSFTSNSSTRYPLKQRSQGCARNTAQILHMYTTISSTSTKAASTAYPTRTASNRRFSP